MEASRPRTEMEEERDFLLRSLRDLETEHDVGDIDDADYVTLKDDYTVRAAAVLRALPGAPIRPLALPGPVETTTAEGEGMPLAAGGDSCPADGPPLVDGPPVADDMERVEGAAAGDEVSGSGGSRPGRRRLRRPVLSGLAALIVVAGVGYTLTASSSHRSAGQTITGQNVGSLSIGQLLQQANAAEVRGDSLTELKDSRTILAKDPTQPEALTLEGWVLAQTQQPKLLAQGIGLLRLAEEIDPNLPQAHAYRAIALLSQGDNRDAVPELEWYLDHKPNLAVAPKFRAALAKAKAALARA